MKKYLFYFSVMLMFGCFSIKVMYTDSDNSLIFQQNNQGQIWLSSMNSAIRIKITKQEQVGDTLFITYKRGPFLSSNNILQLTDRVKYLKCANHLYEVKRTGKEFNLEQVIKN